MFKYLHLMYLIILHINNIDIMNKILCIYIYIILKYTLYIYIFIHIYYKYLLK